MIDGNGLAIPEGEEPLNEVMREALTTKIAGIQNIASLTPTPSADARPVAIYQVLSQVFSMTACWEDVPKEFYDRQHPAQRRIVYATRDSAPSLIDRIELLCRNYVTPSGRAWECGANDMAVKVLELIAASTLREKT